jgi:tRNA N6-adenosine threonylcarbamoyltransferase
MTILGIETSCDETSVAVIEGKNETVALRANVLATSLALHAKTGGIIPEQAAREQIKYILPVIKEALKKTSDTSSTSDTFRNIDAIAVTYGPGLIGSLLVGVETAKTLAYVLNKPIIPVNHLTGHIYANWLTANGKQQIAFPALALVVSGGHTDLLLMKRHGEFQLLGGTRDDAAGEAFDKIGRMLGLSYPAGPAIEQLAKKGNSKRFRFPRPLLHENTYEFSFSGLKTAVLREVKTVKQLNDETINDICRATQDAIIDVLVKKTIKAAKQYNVKSVLFSGGVAANQTLRDEFLVQSSQFKVKLFAPAKSLCTDNAAMIAAAAYFNYKPVFWQDITADPELYF